MNTIQIQLNERQLADLVYLMDEGLDTVSMRPSEHDDYSEEDLAELDRLCGDGISGVRQAIEARSYLWSSGCGRVELDIDARHVDAIAQSGDNEPACRAAIKEDLYLRSQLDELNMGLSRAYLKDAGIDDVDSKDDDMVRVYILWMACHDINDESSEED